MFECCVGRTAHRVLCHDPYSTYAAFEHTKSQNSSQDSLSRSILSIRSIRTHQLSEQLTGFSVTIHTLHTQHSNTPTLRTAHRVLCHDPYSTYAAFEHTKSQNSSQDSLSRSIYAAFEHTNSQNSSQDSLS